MSLELLLVEDDEGHAELVARAFERVEGAVVTRVETLADALQASGPFELVLTDLRLPDGLGTELIDRSPAATPVVVMTSQGDEKAAVEAIKAGAVDYVVKSETTFSEMPRIVERALREHRLIQEQRRLKQALEQNERLAAVGTTAAILAHEIGNPLNSMALYAELLARRLKKLDIDDDQVKRQLDNTTQEIRRLAELLQEFRALAREPDIHRRPVDVGGFIGEVVERYEAAIRDQAIELNVELAGDLGTAELDADKLTQVLLNLLKNAAEAMPDGGAIAVRAWRGHDLVTLVVADTGPGIPEGIDVFEPFRSTKAEGSGLGLAIVQRIVAAHGGTISHGANVPRGAQFELVLPARFAPEPA